MSWATISQAIQSQPGLTSMDVAVAEVVAWIESVGGTQLVGDNGHSYGPFQFNTGGELPAFAAWIGQPMTLPTGQLNPVVTNAAQDPTQAVRFALGQGGYLLTGIEQGVGNGLSGIPLAIWVEEYIQRPNWTNPGPIIAAIINAWDSLIGGKLPPPTTPVIPTPPIPVIPTPVPIPSPTPTPAPNPDIVTVQLPFGQQATADLSGIVGPFVQIGQALGTLPGTLTNIVVSVERFGFILLGIVIMLVGIWVLSRSEPQQVREVA